MRVLLAGLVLFPLVAPYELLLRVNWQHYLNPFFVFAAFISAGATALSAFFIFAAVAGLSSEIVFDKSNSTLTHSCEAPVVRRTLRTYPLSSYRRAATATRDWSDSCPTYHLELTLEDGTVIESGAAFSAEEIDTIRSRVEHFMADESLPETYSAMPEN